MKATELVGKLAIRTKPTKCSGDHSYMSEPILIEKVTDAHIFCRTWMFPEDGHILNSRWLDDAWEDFEELSKGTGSYDRYSKLRGKSNANVIRWYIHKNKTMERRKIRH